MLKLQGQFTSDLNPTPEADPETMTIGTVAQGRDGSYYIVKRWRRRRGITRPLTPARRHWAILKREEEIARNALTRLPFWRDLRCRDFNQFFCRDVPSEDGDCLFACLAHCWNFVHKRRDHEDVDTLLTRLRISQDKKGEEEEEVNVATIRGWIADTINKTNVQDFLAKECAIQDRLLPQVDKWPHEWWSPSVTRARHLGPTGLLREIHSILVTSRYIGNVETLRRLSISSHWKIKHLCLVVLTSTGLYPEIFGTHLADPDAHIVCLFHRIHKAPKSTFVKFHWQIIDWKKQGGTNFGVAEPIPSGLLKLLSHVHSSSSSE